jgi:hypothetical protein
MIMKTMSQAEVIIQVYEMIIKNWVKWTFFE